MQQGNPLTGEERLKLEQEVRSYAHTLQTQATYEHPYRPLALALYMLEEGQTDEAIKRMAIAEGEEWAYIQPRLEPIRETLRRLAESRPATEPIFIY